MSTLPDLARAENPGTICFEVLCIFDVIKHWVGAKYTADEAIKLIWVVICKDERLFYEFQPAEVFFVNESQVFLWRCINFAACLQRAFDNQVNSEWDQSLEHHRLLTVVVCDMTCGLLHGRIYQLEKEVYLLFDGPMAEKKPKDVKPQLRLLLVLVSNRHFKHSLDRTICKSLLPWWEIKHSLQVLKGNSFLLLSTCLV